MVIDFIICNWGESTSYRKIFRFPIDRYRISYQHPWWQNASSSSCFLSHFQRRLILYFLLLPGICPVFISSIKLIQPLPLKLFIDNFPSDFSSSFSSYICYLPLLRDLLQNFLEWLRRELWRSLRTCRETRQPHAAQVIKNTS